MNRNNNKIIHVFCIVVLLMGFAAVSFKIKRIVRKVSTEYYLNYIVCQ